MADEPLMKHPVVRKLEQEAIDRYRAKYPDGTPWQELDHSTRCVWVAYAEVQRGKAGVMVDAPDLIGIAHALEVAIRFAEAGIEPCAEEVAEWKVELAALRRAAGVLGTYKPKENSNG